jgi:hypothetical protein
VVIACIGGYAIIAGRQDRRRTAKRRVAEILGYLLIFSGLAFFILGLTRSE